MKRSILFNLIRRNLRLVDTCLMKKDEVEDEGGCDGNAHPYEYEIRELSRAWNNPSFRMRLLFFLFFFCALDNFLPQYWSYAASNASIYRRQPPMPRRRGCSPPASGLAAATISCRFFSSWHIDKGWDASSWRGSSTTDYIHWRFLRT